MTRRPPVGGNSGAGIHNQAAAANNSSAATIYSTPRSGYQPGHNHNPAL
jgi:hypothetical protein